MNIKYILQTKAFPQTKEITMFEVFIKRVLLRIYIPLANLLLSLWSIRLLPKYLFDREITATYYPEEKRKSKIRIIYDFIWWFIHWGEVNTNYYIYG